MALIPRQLRQQPVEARAGHVHDQEQVGKGRCQLTTWHVENVRQGGGQAARQGRFQGMLDVPLAQRLFVEALAWRRARNHARIPRPASRNGRRRGLNGGN
jgi:hypothetical protein